MQSYNINDFKSLLTECRQRILNTHEVSTHDKGTADLVTDMDYIIEEMIISYIKGLYPDDIIIAEETAAGDLTDAPSWVIDPIDGSVNYSYGSPLFGIQFCRVIAGITEFAALYVPSTDTLYHSILGNGAFKNGLPLTPYSVLPIAKSLISFGDFSKSAPASRPYQMMLIDTLKEEALKIRLFGSSCIDFTALASGQTHCHIMFSKRIWEFRPGLLLLQEAGLVTEEITIPDTDLVAICGAHNPAMLNRVRQILMA